MLQLFKSLLVVFLLLQLDPLEAGISDDAMKKCEAQKGQAYVDCFAQEMNTMGAEVRRQARLGPLTRDLAARLLNESLASPHVTRFEFTKDGFERALSDGLVHKHFDHPAFPQWSFTSEGLRMVGPYLQQNQIVIPLGGSRHVFSFARGLAERVDEVTGIADGPTPSIKEVEYRTACIIPTEMQRLGGYIYCGTYGKRAMLRKYDDGWRVAQ